VSEKPRTQRTIQSNKKKAPFFAYKYLSYKQTKCAMHNAPAFKGAGYQFRSNFDHIFNKYTQSMDLTQSLPNFFGENTM
jgi:hypothetical protein